MTPLTIGPFALVSPLGRGGMGRVWRARHITDGVEVAVKVLTADAARKEDFRAAFRTEVHLHAGLAHPRIVRVLDAGEISAVAAQGSDGELVAGSPYLALDLAAGGTLRQESGRFTWRRLREVLGSLLEALAHAHARGVLHLDLKPSNVLLDTRGQVLLADFGIGRRVGANTALGRTAGTPRYMAPEQFSAIGRVGPWSDLYALGVLGWVLATGRPPFEGTAVELARAHRVTPPGAFQPQHPLPPAFEGWLRWLLAKDPIDRFRHAADALAALDEVSLSGPRPAPFVSTWQHPEPPPPHLAGVGLALYGVRAQPMVDRTVEREALWRALGEVHATGRAGLVLLDGPPGFGKSRLARWLCERAAETGAAEVLVATPRHGSLSGLGQAMAERLGLAGLSWDDRLAELREDLPFDEATVVAALLGDDLPAEFRWSSSRERYVAIARQLLRMSMERPLILWFDDAPLDPAVLELVTSIVSGRAVRPLPVLVVCTAADDALATRQLAAMRWTELAGLPGVTRLGVPALEPADHRVLVRSLLGLQGELAARVEIRTEGNPLFAVELVRDWVARGALVATRSGFRLVKGVRIALSDDLYAVWRERLSSGLQGRPASDRAAVELAATLGSEVDVAEWMGACTLAGVTPGPDLVSVLSAARLVRVGVGRFGFIHAAFREAVLRWADEAGRLPRFHAVCAQMIEQQRSHDPGRLGRHLVGAGRPEEAFALLLQGADEVRAVRNEFGQALVVLAEADDALARARVPASDERWGHVRWRRLRCLRALAAYTEVAGQLPRLSADATTHRWHRVLPEVHFVRAEMLRDRGDLPAAEASLAIAKAGYAAIGDDVGHLTAEVESGYLAYWQGRYAAGAEIFRDVAARVAETGSAYREADALYGQAICTSALGDNPTAESLGIQAGLAYAARGNRLGIAKTQNVLGGIYAAIGDSARAIATWRDAVETYDAIGSGDALIVRLNLAQAMLRAGRSAEATDEIAAARATLNLGARAFFAAALDVLAAWSAAQLGVWSEVDTALDSAEARFAKLHSADQETPLAAEAVAETAEAAGQRGRARRAWLLALSRWERAGNSERVAAILARLEGLTGSTGKPTR